MARQFILERQIEYGYKVHAVDSGILLVIDESEFIEKMNAGEYECINVRIENNTLVKNNKTLSNLKELKNYEFKQNAIGIKMFEFMVSDFGIISIQKYFDSPSRSVVIVPDFVTEIQSGAFNGSRNIEKIVFNSNIFILQYAFELIFSEKIIIDGDTSNVSNLESLFRFGDMNEITLSDRFTTDKIKITRSMFQNCSKLKQINFGKTFDLCNVNQMNYMFRGCESLNNLKLDHEFNCSNVKLCLGVFDNCNEEFLNKASKYGLGEIAEKANKEW